MADAGELKAVISAETSDFISKMNELVGAVQNVGDRTSQGFEAASGALEHFKSSFEMAAEFAGFNVGLEQAVDLLKELATEAVEAYSKIELMTAGMTALTGSTQATNEVLEQLKELSASTIFSFPDLAQAAQKMAALGIAADDIPRVLKSAAEAAELLGAPLEGVAQALDNVYTKGQLTLRALPQLGLTWQDLATALESTATNSKEVLAQFNAIADPMEKVNILADAMHQKFGDAADAMKDTLSVQVNALKTDWHEMLVEFGKEIAPDLKTVLADLQSVMPVLEHVVLLVGKLVSFSFDQLKQGFNDIKGFFNEINSGLAAFQGHLDAAAEGIKKWTGLDFTAHGALGQQLNDLTDNTNKTSAAFTTLGQNAMQTSENTKTFRESIQTTTPHVTELTGEVGKLSVASIDALKQLGLIGSAPDPFKSLDDSAQKAFDTFLRGFQGVSDEWNTAAAGMDPEKLLGQLKLLEAELIQNGQQGSLAFIQVQDAIKGVGDYLVNHLSPDATRVSQDIRNETDKTIAKYGELTTKIETEAAKKPIDPLVDAMKQLGIESTNTKGKITADLAAVDTLVQSNIATMADYDQAWITLTSDAHKYANDPAILPKIIQAEKDIVQGLTDQGAPLGEIYSKNAEILTQEINLATQRGTDATAQIIALENIHIKQQALIDQATLGGQVYKDLMGDFKGAFDALGKGIADNIVDGKSWGDMFMGILKDLEKEILEQLIGVAFKKLEDTILTHTNLLGGLASKIAEIFTSKATDTAVDTGVDAATKAGTDAATKAATGAASSAVSSGASSALSSAMSMMAGIGSAVSAVSGVISNFQMAKQETTLNAIELNTRMVAMFIGGLGGHGVTDWLAVIAVNTTPLLDIDSWIHDAWVELLGGKDTLLGLIGPGGWIHDYMANGQGPNLDLMANNSNLLLERIDRLVDVTVQGIQQMTVTINALGITTKEAASQLADQIGKTLQTQMAGSSLR